MSKVIFKQWPNQIIQSPNFGYLTTLKIASLKHHSEDICYLLTANQVTVGGRESICAPPGTLDSIFCMRFVLVPWSLCSDLLFSASTEEFPRLCRSFIMFFINFHSFIYQYSRTNLHMFSVNLHTQLMYPNMNVSSSLLYFIFLLQSTILCDHASPKLLRKAIHPWLIHPGMCLITTTGLWKRKYIVHVFIAIHIILH